MAKKVNKSLTTATRKAVGKPQRGAPAKFQTPQEMQDKIDEYFASCKPTFLTVNGKTVLDKNKNPMIDYHPATIAGMALYLGFESRQSMYDYAKRENFSYVVARARLRIEAEREADICAGRNVEGSKFHLANMSGWKEEQRHAVELNASVSTFSVNQFLEKFNAK